MPGLSSPYGAILRLVSGVPVTATTISISTLASTSDSARIAIGPVISRVPIAARSAPAPTSAPEPDELGALDTATCGADVVDDGGHAR